MFHCTSSVLPPGGRVRESARPPALRQPGYDEAFDATTLFYDVVAMPAPRNHLLFIAPPFLNLLPAFYSARLNGYHLATASSSYYLRDRCCDVWVPDWRGGDVTLDTELGSFELSPQPARHDLYAGKRVLYTLSKDNEIGWIREWVTFHVRNHGADAILLYDNGSSLYTGAALEESLRAAFPGLEVNVVNWPYKYGPQGVSELSGWDSDFCQAGAFQDARFRFLASASSVLNCDIDELVVSARGTSVFDATERSAGGCLMFKGSWISNALLDTSSDTALPSDRRHGQFMLVERGTIDRCPTKWCVVPSRCAMDDHWSTHTVQGKDTSGAYSREFSYRHFRSISTSWKYQRHWSVPVDQDRDRFDAALARNFARAGIRHDRPRPSGPWSAVVRHITRSHRLAPRQG